MLDVRKQAITGVVPPQQDEALIRERWPSVARMPAVANLGRQLTRTIVLAPLAWLLMAPIYFAKVLPVLARRYAVTNKRLLIRGGWSGRAVKEVPLEQIDDVRLRADANSNFFRAATLEIVSGGNVVMTLPGTPDPESFRVAIVNACNAWVPGRSKRLAFIPASTK
jgi:hypothetical protein